MASASHRVVRISKFRNVYGTNWKRDQCYDNIKVSKSAWDATFCSVNPKFLAVITESAGGGAFIVLPINKEKVGRMKSDHPVVSGHKGPVLDIAWCPHDDNIIVSGSEDCSAKIWNIPDEGLASTVTEPLVALLYHQRRVGLVLWHPTAENVLLTAGSDNLVVIWNVGEAEPAVVIECHPDVVYSASWNWDGSKLLTTCKDKKIRIINPRSGEIEEEAVCHEGSKACRAIYLKNGLIFTTGFSKVSERQYSLREPTHLADPMVMTEVDTSNGVMFPFYDVDTNMVYLCGKGDSVIRYFEVTPEPPYVHYINTFQTPDPQRGIGMMPKRGCDVNSCEITRFYRLNSSGLCQVVSMTVPRKSELFQEDLYPDTISPVAALSAVEWFAGKNENPLTMSLKTGISISCRLYEDETDVAKKRRLSCDISSPLQQHMRLGRSNSLSHTSVTKTLSLPPNVRSPTRDNDPLLDEITQLKKELAAQEERVRVLELCDHEERIQKLESLQLEKRIQHLESFNIEELISSLESLKTRERIEVANTTPLKCANCQSLMNIPRHSTPATVSIPSTPPNDRANLSVFEQFTNTIVPQLPFSGAVTMLTTMLTTPLNVLGNQLPSPMSAAQSLSSLPPLKALSAFSKWIPNQSISSLSSTLISSLTVNRLSNSPQRSAGPATSSL